MPNFIAGISLNLEVSGKFMDKGKEFSTWERLM